jgi:hypothetical protein
VRFRVVLPGVKRSRESKDVAPPLPEVWRVLKAHRSSLNEQEHRSGLVYPTPDGRHHERTILGEVFVKLWREADIKKRFTPHGCRRTAAAVYRTRSPWHVSPELMF